MGATRALPNSSGRSPHRFFSAAGFWNQPIPPDAKVDSCTERWIKLLETEPSGENFFISCEQWTIPVYEVDETGGLSSIPHRHYRILVGGPDTNMGDGRS